MGSGAFFVFTIIPWPYWIGIMTLAGIMVFIIRYLEDYRFRVLLVFSSILLIIGFRMVFPVTFTSIPAYEPDATNYMNVVNAWVTSGVNFGVQGQYQHNFPMSFLIAFTIVKLGVPVDTFFRIAPFFIYAFEIVVLYLLVKELIPEDKRYAAASTFLFSFSSLGYWVTVHYSPDLVGSLFYFVSLYLSVGFAKKGEWSVKALSPVLLSIFVLILSHHLSTLYLIMTLFGLSFSVWYFKPPQIKGKALSLFLLAICTYSLWFAYGTLVYPSFFNVYVYFSGFSSVTGLSQGAGLLNNVTFVIYPIFILALFIYSFLRTMQIQNPWDLTKLRKKFRETRATESASMPFVYSVGFVFVSILFLAGFAAPVIQAPRILEILCVGLYPIASQTLIKVSRGNPSRKKMILMLIIVLVVVTTGIYRYDSQIQRRVLG
jgi:hypothetical protein